MKNKKMNNKGITLIALIITIIVMLILVGVTVNVALNGGIFENAKQARKNTEESTILEQLVAMSTWTSGGKINVDNLILAAQAKYGESKVSYNSENGKLTITGKYEEYKYKVTAEEISIWEDGNEDNPPPQPPEDDEEVGAIITNTELLTKLGITDYTGTYEGNWELIKEESGTKTYVTIEKVGECILGDASNFEVCIYDYINAASKIESVVTTATQEINARSVTIEDIEEILEIGNEERIAATPEYGDKYKYYYDNGTIYSECQKRGTNTWSEPFNTYETTLSLVENGEEKTISANNPGPVTLTTNSYYTNNSTQVATLGTLGQGLFCLPKIALDCAGRMVMYSVFTLYEGNIYAYPLFTSLPTSRQNTFDVRAIVTIETPIS